MPNQASCECDCSRGGLLQVGMHCDPAEWSRCPCTCCPDQQGRLHACRIMVHDMAGIIRRFPVSSTRHVRLERPFCDDCEAHRRTAAIAKAAKRRRLGSDQEGAALHAEGEERRGTAAKQETSGPGMIDGRADSALLVSSTHAMASSEEVLTPSKDGTARRVEKRSDQQQLARFGAY